MKSNYDPLLIEATSELTAQQLFTLENGTTNSWPDKFPEQAKAKVLLPTNDSPAIANKLSDPFIPIRSVLIKSWHAHIYFDIDQKSTADRIRQYAINLPRATNKLNFLNVGLLNTRPVSVHPRSQFQIHFTNNWFSEVIRWLIVNRQGLDVLIHPVIGKEDEIRTKSVQLTELVAHTEMALWLGNKLKLNLNELSGW